MTEKVEISWWAKVAGQSYNDNTASTIEESGASKDDGVVS